MLPWFSYLSGTHWTDEIVAMLLSQSTDYNSKGNFLHSLLEFEEIETLNAAKGQRLLHSHRHGRDRMVVGFIITCAISAYHY
jgi:hypothetical protein